MGGLALAPKPTLRLASAADRTPKPWLVPSLLAGWGAALGAVLFAVAYRAMLDDALITLSFARNVAESGCWCLSDGIESNTATSPLYVALLAAATWVTGHPFWAAGAVLALALALVALWMRRIGGATAGALAPLMLASSPIFASAVGMETFLVAAVLVGTVRFAMDGRWVTAGVLVGSAWLTRPDVLLPAVVAVLVFAAVLRSRRLLAALPVGGLVAAPWTVFSWLHFGSMWANSATAKWANGSWGGWTLTDWSFFYPQWPQVTVVVAATLVIGLLALIGALWQRNWPAVALGAAGAAHLGMLAVATTPPIFYYYGPSLAGLSMAAVLVASRWRPALVGPVAVITVGLVVLIGNGPWWGLGFAPIRENYASDAQYAAIAAGLPKNGYVLAGEIGALAYYCHDYGCHVVDSVLSDPGRTDQFVARWRTEHPTMSAVNFRNYRVPPPIPVGYELPAGFASPGPGPAWPITRNPGIDQWIRLVPAQSPTVIRR